MKKLLALLSITAFGQRAEYQLQINANANDYFCYNKTMLHAMHLLKQLIFKKQ